MPPRISVIIPCYNAAGLLSSALQSLLTQTRPASEIIVVDDGSTDETGAVLARFAGRGVQVMRQANRGPAAARNTGITAATGDYLALLDADDIALPHRLATQAALLDRDHALAVATGGYEWIDPNGEPLPWPYHSWRHYPDLNDLRTWLFDCPIVPSATMLRREAWQRVGGFDESLVGPEDWDFWMRLVLAGERFAWNHEVVCGYRRLPGSLSAGAARMGEHSVRALEGIMARPDFPATLTPIGRHAVALRHADAAKRLFWSGAWQEGRASLAAALAHDHALLAGSPCRLEDELVAAAMDPLVAEPIAFLSAALDYLPEEARGLAARRGPILLRCRGELLLRGLARRDPLVWRYLAGLRLRPAWILDHGLRNSLLRAVQNRTRRRVQAKENG